MKTLILTALLGVVVATTGAVSANAGIDAKSFFEQSQRDFGG